MSRVRSYENYDSIPQGRLTDNTKTQMKEVIKLFFQSSRSPHTKGRKE